MGYVLAFLGGLFVGIVLTTICLCKKNLEAYTNISKTTENSFKQNLETAKALYNQEIYGNVDGKNADEATEEVNETADAEEVSA